MAAQTDAPRIAPLRTRRVAYLMTAEFVADQGAEGLRAKIAQLAREFYGEDVAPGDITITIGPEDDQHRHEVIATWPRLAP